MSFATISDLRHKSQSAERKKVEQAKRKQRRLRAARRMFYENLERAQEAAKKNNVEIKLGYQKEGVDHDDNLPSPKYGSNGYLSRAQWFTVFNLIAEATAKAKDEGGILRLRVQKRR